MWFNKALILIFLLGLLSDCVLALNMPTVAKGKPKIFDDVRLSYSWENRSRSRDWGEFSSKVWHIYVADDKTIAYDSPEASSQLMKLEFMEDFYVADLKGDYALLFYSNEVLKGLSIPATCNKKSVKDVNGRRSNGYVGWVNVDNLLLWTVCPRTKDGVYKKVAVVKDVDHIRPENVDKVPCLYKDEACKVSSEMYVSNFDFYFLYKKSKNGNVLVYVNYETDEKMLREKVGWIEYGEYIPWDTRVCWEIAFDEGDGNSLNDTARTFVSDDAALDCDISHQISRAVITKERKKPIFPRSPILNYNSRNFVAQMAVIGNTNGGMSDEDRAKLDSLKESLSNINVVFVMDATLSMENSFTEMSRAVEKIFEYRNKDKYTIKYGVVAYRNYKDEADGNLTEIYPLSSSTSQISDFLKNVKCFSAEHIEYPEAMFYGLSKAADMLNDPNQSNFIILITDVSSKDPDDKNLTKDYIVNRLAQNNINLVAFQSARNCSESDNFGSQVGEIIELVLEKKGYSTASTFNSKIDAEYYMQNTQWPLRPMAFRITEKDYTPDQVLYKFATDIIWDFIDKTDENIMIMERALAGETDNVIDKSVCEELILRKIIKKCEDLKGAIKVQGYSRMSNCSNRQMFTPCVFMAEPELTELIKGLEKVVTNTSSTRRTEMQRQCINLILSYTGQKFDVGALNDDDAIPDIIKSIEAECGYEFYKDVKTHIENPNRLSDDDFDIIVNRLRSDIEKLKDVQKDSSTRLEQDKKRYYYILLSDMPLVKKM